MERVDLELRVDCFQCCTQGLGNDGPAKDASSTRRMEEWAGAPIQVCIDQLKGERVLDEAVGGGGAGSIRGVAVGHNMGPGRGGLATDTVNGK
jgi:uncharacterized protein YcfJ